MNKFIAYFAANNEYEEFETYEEAEKWLQDIYNDDGEYSEETMNGQDYIAEIKAISKFKEITNKEKDGYKWSEEGQGFFLDGNPNEEEWPYNNEHDSIGIIEFV